MSKIPLYWLPVVAWAALISLFSTDTFHGGWSQGIVRSVLHLIMPDLNQEIVELLHTIVRKLAHMTEYCIFTLLLYRGFRQDAPNGRQWRWGVASAFGGGGFAGVDEFHQTFEPMRTGSVIDVGIDSVGALAALVMIRWHPRRR